MGDDEIPRLICSEGFVMANGCKPSESELGCSSQTVLRRLHRFNAERFEGLDDRPRAGRPRRLRELERSKISALVRTPPPGWLSMQADGTMVARKQDGSAQWSLDLFEKYRAVASDSLLFCP